MNTLTFIRSSRTAVFYSAMTILSLILSALPAAFFVAEAESIGVTLGSATATVEAGEKVNFVVSTLTDDSVTTPGTYFSVSDGGSGGDFFDGTIAGACNQMNADIDNQFDVDQNQGVCYSNDAEGVYNVSVQLLDSLGGNPIGALEQIEITVTAAVPACSLSVAGPTDIQNANSGNYFDTVADALDDCDTSDGDSIQLLGDISISEQITIDRPVTLDGGGFAIDPAFTKTDNDNNSAIGVQSDDVSVQNIVINGENGTDLHGINVFESMNVLIDNVISKDNDKSGIVVNGSKVRVKDVTTSGNGIHGINADKSGTVLTVEKTSSHDEFGQIYVDNPADVIIIDEDKQYTRYPVDLLGSDLYGLRPKGLEQNEPLPNCIADVEARVVLREGESVRNVGSGNLDEKVFLGNGEVVSFGTWFNLSEASEWLVDEEMAENFSDPESKDGLFVSREGEGLIRVALHGFHEKGSSEALKATIEFNDGTILGYEDMVMYHQLEEHSASVGDGFDGVVVANDKTFVDFDFWTGTGGDGIAITLDNETIADCGDDTDPEEEPVDVEVVLGCTDSEAENYNQDATDGNSEAEMCEYPSSGGSSSGGSSSGTRVSQSLPLIQPTPQVLGVSTSNVCPFLFDYMQIGIENDAWEVTKLQAFLNIFVAENPITGVFGEITDANVKTFQERYRSEILDPWLEKGIVSHNNPTGFVYKTTLWKINSMICPDVTNLPDFTGEDLDTNVDLHKSGISD